jgi:hypothetical protein
MTAPSGLSHTSERDIPVHVLSLVFAYDNPRGGAQPGEGRPGAGEVIL